MKKHREWSDELEALWYGANRRLRAWEWGAKIGAIRLDRDYYRLKDELKKVRAIVDNQSAIDALKDIVARTDKHLSPKIKKYCKLPKIPHLTT